MENQPAPESEALPASVPADSPPADTAKRVLTQLRDLFLKPRVFFATLPKETGYRDAFVFLLPVVLFFSVIKTLVSGHVLLAPVVLVITVATVFVEAGEIWIFGKILKAPVGYKSAFTIVSYSRAPFVLGWIPMVGWAAAFYSLFLIFFGLWKLLDLTPQKAGQVVFCLLVLSTIGGMVFKVH